MSNAIKYRKHSHKKFFTVAPGVWGFREVFVNVYMIINPFDGNWVLVDAGLKWSAQKIKNTAEHLFGKQARPSSIILTHGHFDHVGALKILLREWNAPVFAHYLEIPFLTGKSPYPAPDPTVGGGLISLMSWMYPRSPINISEHVHILPENGRVPGLPEWKYIHTPGHAPGHISLFRESDGVLIAGDAFVTTRAESVFSMLVQSKKLSGPPKYFTYDWLSAKESVKKLMDLEPEIAATGHGKPMQGDVLRNSLQMLSENFAGLAVPLKGRYVNDFAVTNATGVIYLPPVTTHARARAIRVLALIALVAVTYALYTKKRKKNSDKKALAYEVW